MRIPREVMQRRDQEFEAAQTEAEVAELQRKWRAEDDARERAADWRNRELAELRRRVAYLERKLFDSDGRRWSRAVHEALAEASVICTNEVLTTRGVLCYRGEWDSQTAYARGAVVAIGRGLWLARAATVKGERPASSPCWTRIGD